MARRKVQGSDGRWRWEGTGKFTSAPKRRKKAPPIVIRSMADAIYEAAKRGLTFTIPAGVGLQWKPIEPPKPESAQAPRPLPESGRIKEKDPDPLFHFRKGKTHLDMRQARGDLESIKRWIKDWNADWHRNRDGSYQAQIAIGEDASFREGDPGALDTLQTAAEDVSGPALIRFGLWFKEDPAEKLLRGKSPSPTHDAGEITLVMHLTRLGREYQVGETLADGWRHGEPETDRGRLQVMWPSVKGDERR